MRSCQNPAMFCHKRALILHRNPLLLYFPCCQGFRRNAKFRCVLDQIVPKFAVSSSLSSVLTSGNAIAAAAAVAGTGSLHGAVSSAITQVAVTAVAIASGACLSTKVDFLWPKVDEQPGSLLLDGVDVTGYPIFNDDKVQKAIAFARKAHHGQLRRTGEPYLTHCIHTGKIVAVLVPSTGKRAIDTVVAGILHDVIDDTSESLDTIEREFDTDVANLVAGVSRLSYINQLLRRHRRLNVNQAALSQEEANSLRVMLLGMVDDPRVVLIKLADRLHNMRTIYALPPAKAQAVAQETLAIWCSLASRLGLWALKAELEDLCFAVLQPQIFLRMRADLASMWSHPNRTGNARKIYGKSSSLLHQRMKSMTAEHEEPAETDEEYICMKVLLQAVLPFDLLLDRKKRIDFFNKLVENSNLETKPKVVRDAAFALGSLVVCEEALERELFISTSYVPGMEVTLSARLKSLFSIYSKMKRKEIGINKVYDARALRVIVGDKNGALHGQAVQCCYNLLNIVHRLWSPIDGEFDDYIVNPKPSGYQSLHTAVQGPDNSPLEIQIRTQRMHECAEHGLAAHWLYKETEDKLPLETSVTGSGTTTPSYFSTDIEDQGSIVDDGSHKYSSLKVGHPVLRVEAGHLLAAVIVRVDKDARELLVAVSFGLAASEAVADRRSSQTKRWEAYASLYKKVSDEWWFEPGHGDWCTCLEKYTLCQDGMYHKQDQFQRMLPTFIQIIELTEEEENLYKKVKTLLSSQSLALPIEIKADDECASLPPKMCETHMGTYDGAGTSSVRRVPRMVETGILSKIPPEMLHHILKFLSSEDLVACLLVCKFLNGVASDESLWRRLYCLRWGLVLPTKKPRECAWKKLYIKRDADDMVEFVRNCPTEFKEYYIQMQTAKRSQAPLLSQINDDRIILDKTVADQVYIWKKSKGLGDNVVNDHACSGKTCAYHQIGDVFVCEKTGNVHVCDDTCREVVLDPINGLLVCTISGHCLDTMLLLPDETEPDVEQQQTGAADELEPFMGSGRFARAYELGYNCDDEKELEAALLFC